MRRLRQDRGLSQSELAELADLAPGTIGDIERGRQGAGKKIDLLAAALGKTAEYIRTGEGEDAPVLESSLSPREMRLIDRFRSMNGPTKIRLEDFAAGLQGAIKDRQPRLKQTAQEIRGVKTRRSG